MTPKFQKIQEFGSCARLKDSGYLGTRRSVNPDFVRLDPLACCPSMQSMLRRQRRMSYAERTMELSKDHHTPNMDDDVDDDVDDNDVDNVDFDERIRRFLVNVQSISCGNNSNLCDNTDVAPSDGAAVVAVGGEMNDNVTSHFRHPEAAPIIDACHTTTTPIRTTPIPTDHRPCLLDAWHKQLIPECRSFAKENTQRMSCFASRQQQQQTIGLASELVSLLLRQLKHTGNDEDHEATAGSAEVAAMIGRAVSVACGPIAALAAAVDWLRLEKKPETSHWQCANPDMPRRDTESSSSSDDGCSSRLSWYAAEYILARVLFGGDDRQSSLAQQQRQNHEKDFQPGSVESKNPRVETALANHDFRTTTGLTESIWAEHDFATETLASSSANRSRSSTIHPTWIVPNILALPGLLRDSKKRVNNVRFSLSSSTWWNVPLHIYHRSLIVAACTALQESQTLLVPPTPATGTIQNKVSTINKNSAESFWLWTQLVTSLLRRQDGDMDVAAGLYQWFAHQIREQSHQNGRGDNNKCDAAGVGCNDTAALKPFVERLLTAAVDSLNGRTAAILCRAFLRFYIAKIEKQNRYDAAKGTTEGDVSWFCLFCSPFMQRYGPDVTRLVVLSSSSVKVSNTSQTSIDPSLCILFAKILASKSLAMVVKRSFHDTVTEDDDSNDDCGRPTETDIEIDQLPAPQQLLYKHLCFAADTWAATLFVRHTDASLQHHATAFILECLSQLLSLRASGNLSRALQLEGSVLVSHLMQGVTARLGCTNSSAIRKDGMKVGERLAVILGQDLTFDELTDHDRHNGEQMEMVEEIDKEKNESTGGAVKKFQARRIKTRIQNWDPDALCQSSDEETSAGSDASSIDDDDSEWGDDDNVNNGFAPYDLEDDWHDMGKTPLPFYLSECLDYLRTPDNDENIFSRHETGLRELSRLARARPSDLHDLGPELARNVLHFENKFDMEGFPDMVSEALCSLTIGEPIGVGKTLIAEMFQDASLSNRLVALRALEDAAFELYGLGENPVNSGLP